MQQIRFDRAETDGVHAIVDASADGTRYQVVTTYLPESDGRVIALVNFGVCYSLPKDQDYHWSYLAVKFGGNPCTGKAMALILNKIDALEADPRSDCQDLCPCC